MRDTTYILSEAIFNALNGQVVYNGNTITIADEKKKSDDTSDLYILFSTQQEVPENTFETFMTKSILDIEICHKTGQEVSKKDMSGVANAVLEILLPTTTTTGITQPSGFEIQQLEYAGSITRAMMISPTESILRKFIKVQAVIIQQS
jgi:hypothetical protein